MPASSLWKLITSPKQQPCTSHVPFWEGNRTASGHQAVPCQPRAKEIVLCTFWLLQTSSKRLKLDKSWLIESDWYESQTSVVTRSREIRINIMRIVTIFITLLVWDKFADDWYDIVGSEERRRILRSFLFCVCSSWDNCFLVHTYFTGNGEMATESIFMFGSNLHVCNDVETTIHVCDVSFIFKLNISLSWNNFGAEQKLLLPLLF